MKEVALKLPRSAEQYEQALSEALDAMDEVWSGSADIELVKELQAALRVAAA